MVFTFQRPLACHIALMFLQRCRSQLIDYNFRIPYFANQIRNPQHYEYNLDIYNPPIHFRRNSLHSDSDSTSSDGEKILDYVCTCDECKDPKDCCLEFCHSCPASGEIGFAPDQAGQGQVGFNIPKPSPNLVVIPYAVPVLIFPIKRWNQKLQASEEPGTSMSHYTSPETYTSSLSIGTPETATMHTTTVITPESQSQEENEKISKETLETEEQNRGKSIENKEIIDDNQEIPKRDQTAENEIPSIETAKGDETPEETKITAAV